MKSNELYALADKWHAFAITEAARAGDYTKSHWAGELAVEAAAMFEVAEHLRLAAFTAEGIEARQGGNGEAGSVHESPVAEGDAPEGTRLSPNNPCDVTGDVE